MFIKEFDKGNVYVSKKHTNKIFELLENDDDKAIQKLIDEEKALKYKAEEFRADNELNFLADLKSDLEILRQIKILWHRINRDPKLIKFLQQLTQDKILKENKLIIFTESKETAEYLAKNINEKFPDVALCYTGGSGEATRDIVIKNFDDKARHPENDYRILVSTEVLSEGVNLHRSNVVINYDIPWNPTRMMQRVGRINRLDTKFDKIYTFNFFPSQQGNDEIKLRESAEAKINAFLTLLGGDAALLTEGEPVGSHELFNRLVSKKTLTGEDESEESELKYLQVIKDLRDKEPDLFEQIKLLPKKSRTAKIDQTHRESLITYFRRGKLQKFFTATEKGEAQELDFLTAASIIESSADEEKQILPEEFYDLLDKNKEAFIFATTEEMLELQTKRGKDSAMQVYRMLKAAFKSTRQFTDDQELYIKKVYSQLEEGGLPKQTTKETLAALNKLKEELANPFKVLAILQMHIPERLLEAHYAEQNQQVTGKREVILSMYMKGNR
jgi:superfamily II DNA/RNA helicase